MAGRAAPTGAVSGRSERISLLWPSGHPIASAPVTRLPAGAGADLDLDELIRALSGGDGRRERFVGAVLAELAIEPDIIAFRQEVVADLVADPQLRSRLANVLPGLSTLARERGHNPRETWSVLLIAQRLAELEVYVDVALQLRHALASAAPTSRGCQALLTHIIAVTDAPEFQALKEELPALRARLDQAGSITIGINLSRDLVPESAAVLSVSAEKIEGRGTLLERLLGKAEQRGITPLRLADANNIYAAENRLYRDLRKLLEIVAGPVGHAIDRYTSINARALNTLEPELAFLLNGVALMERLQAAGLPVCRPEVRPLAERVTGLTDAYNVSLALRVTASRPPADEPAPRVITNAMAFDDTARVWILTGPNRGGKTTYTRAIGLAHLLFQAGLPVPAASARMSPVDAIYTHFPSPEGAQLGMGRLDEEAERLAGIFQAATPFSLILLNEVLAGTSAIEALGLAEDAVRGLCLLGARAIYTTHLHELARGVGDLNDGASVASRAASLVAGVDAEGSVVSSGHRRTFRIVPGPPRGVSYASEIAEQHGISYGQIASLLDKRGVLLREGGRTGGLD